MNKERQLEIDLTLEVLRTAWYRSPDLRLGQLINNHLYLLGSDPNYIGDRELFYASDEGIRRALRRPLDPDDREKNENPEFKTYEDFFKKIFPRRDEEEKKAQETPAELGERLGKELVDRIIEIYKTK